MWATHGRCPHKRFQLPNKNSAGELFCWIYALFFPVGHNFRTYSLRIFRTTLICHWQTTKPAPHRCTVHTHGLALSTHNGAFVVHHKMYTCSDAEWKYLKKNCLTESVPIACITKPPDALFVRSRCQLMEVEKKVPVRREKCKTHDNNKKMY